jgi:hypothetical protein
MCGSVKTKVEKVAAAFRHDEISCSWPDLTPQGNSRKIKSSGHPGNPFV